MANNTIATDGSGSGLLPSGAVGFGGIVNVEDEIPETYKPAVVYKNARGKYVDPYGREVTELGTLQKAGVSASAEQKATTQYNQQLDGEIEDIMSEGYDAHTVAELDEILESRSLSKDGNKADKVERLEADDNE